MIPVPLILPYVLVLTECRTLIILWFSYILTCPYYPNSVLNCESKYFVLFTCHEAVTIMPGIVWAYTTCLVNICIVEWVFAMYLYNAVYYFYFDYRENLLLNSPRYSFLYNSRVFSLGDHSAHIQNNRYFVSVLFSREPKLITAFPHYDPWGPRQLLGGQWPLCAVTLPRKMPMPHT